MAERMQEKDVPGWGEGGQRALLEVVRQGVGDGAMTGKLVPAPGY